MKKHLKNTFLGPFLATTDRPNLITSIFNFSKLLKLNLNLAFSTSFKNTFREILETPWEVQSLSTCISLICSGTSPVFSNRRVLSRLTLMQLILYLFLLCLSPMMLLLGDLHWPLCHTGINSLHVLTWWGIPGHVGKTSTGLNGSHNLFVWKLGLTFFIDF